MAAKPKLSPEGWAKVRKAWESDLRDGYVWLIEDLNLDISKTAIRKIAIREGWKKRIQDKPSEIIRETNKTQPDAKKPSAKSKASKGIKKVPKVSQTMVPQTSKVPQGNHDEGSETIGEFYISNYTDFKEDYIEQAYRLCLLGATDKELGEFFHVSEQTINNWKKDYPPFFESIKEGKSNADARVAQALYKRATGYSHKEVHVSNYRGDITLTELTKEYPPDTAAAIIWLKNRQPDKWRDKIETNVDVKLNKETLQEIEQLFVENMAKARERQQAVLIERGITIDHE